MSPLSILLDHYRSISQSEREKGTYFEELMLCYLRTEPYYQDQYAAVWLYGDWAATQGLSRQDTGIDLVAMTRGIAEYHAIQCKFYSPDHVISKGNIDSFFTASGKTTFSHRIIITTTPHWNTHARTALENQHPPVTVIDLPALEASQIDWAQYQPENKTAELKPRKTPREHQVAAIKKVVAGLKTAERGKLIMACGTGKTFTALNIAEAIGGAGGRVLFCVPSLNLLSQTLTEWTQQSQLPLHSFAVCSDTEVGNQKPTKKQDQDADQVDLRVSELQYPATTNAAQLAMKIAQCHDAEHLTVVFSTYHSIHVLHEAQVNYQLPPFDLIICDEAHRTTGAIFNDAEESAFVRVHDNAYVRANKRLYMTATPRIYANTAKAIAERDNVTLCSMDDEQLYGQELFVLNFSEAVWRKLLVDYKVVVLTIDEAHVSRRIQELLKDENNQLKIDDAAKIVGCWKALAKYGLTEQLTNDATPMQRAVAFCQVIEPNQNRKTHRVSSKHIAAMFQLVVEAYQQQEQLTTAAVAQLKCETRHVDGSMGASEKAAHLQWLRDAPPDNTCRILSNVRCLSEGVDVPTLDAVLFLAPRNSQVDVVQAVGRVMRIAENKKRGYVILPVVIPAGMTPHEALNDNKTYAVVWEVLQALRSHDDHFDAFVNKLEWIGRDTNKMEVIAITDHIGKATIKKGDKTARRANKKRSGRDDFTIGEAEINTPTVADQGELTFAIGEIERGIYAKLVEKCGNRHHWEDWANDIAKIANTHIDRITGILANPANTNERAAFEAFAHELRDDVNDSLSDGDIIEMLAQHLITEPVFAALFADYEFAKYNPMSQAMQAILTQLHEHHLHKETDTLQGFYDSVKVRAAGIDNAAGKQKIIVELYDKFFRNAFPKLTERLGIVYTPVEVVDFILHSVNELLTSEFQLSLGSAGVHILDPFTGTGTFLTRLLQSGLITREQLPFKYQSEIHANEMVLLAYYIAAINIESTYHSLVSGSYQPFAGMCLTDTFQLYEKGDLMDALLIENSSRRRKQTQLPVQVIIGNPPYSIGQGSQNDNNANVDYPGLNKRIGETYAAKSKSINAKSLYDSYIRAIRWASDRIGDNGIIGFVSGSGFIEKPATDGMRKCLFEEFSSIHVLNLRGDIRKNMLSKGRAKEGENIFGSGSMTGIAITFFVKNPAATQQGQIYYHDIGNALKRADKLGKMTELVSIAGITAANGWQLITPDAHGDWLNQRDDSFNDFIVLGDKKSGATKLFDNFSLGVVTNRDTWCYNASRNQVAANMERMIAFYNQETARFQLAVAGLDKKILETKVDELISTDPSQISWSRALKQELVKGRQFSFAQSNLITSLYRPFTKQWLYYDRRFNEMVYQMPRIFPDTTADNVVICVTGIGARSGFSVLLTNLLPNLHTLDTGQCFPLYLYDDAAPANDNLFATELTRTRRDAITDAGLAHIQAHYPNEPINKTDLFYYIYGLLHSPDYRARYADNLSKEQPRIPCVKSAADFWAFSQAGRQLAELHLNYETVAPYPVTIKTNKAELTAAEYRVIKMKYGKPGVPTLEHGNDQKRGKDKDLTTVIYNDFITISDIPLTAYEYIVNGKPALDWVMERQGVKTDKDSGIVNDANDWAIETMNNPRYPLELFQRVVTVSVETVGIVKQLPTLT
ncbi:DEAD/DEAH box helicase [Rhodoferax sp. 4810]|uniref:DEAD/DEAH box helicase n=1 Tax=Thiospirillum jenense TaxID=1653858 RepID=A0A839H2H1_9GAMM|nr:type ISP restriction/modification enzyme [Thiospirillum jenense]MBB1073146.1 DEAD/DEAH box helicase [Rhodoferax jenense]MBB1124693.1 DEAD/DEAH box helicase [Thiospirillum jenense]